MHGVYDLTWAWLCFLVAAVAEKKEELLYLYFSTCNKRSGRAGLQSDLLFLYTFCLDLSSARV